MKRMIFWMTMLILEMMAMAIKAQNTLVTQNVRGQVCDVASGELNGTVLANSDFLTGAMPAEYGNALSGALDMKMRAGNNTKYEHAIQGQTFDIRTHEIVDKFTSLIFPNIAYRVEF